MQRPTTLTFDQFSVKEESLLGDSESRGNESIVNTAAPSDDQSKDSKDSDKTSDVVAQVLNKYKNEEEKQSGTNNLN